MLAAALLAALAACGEEQRPVGVIGHVEGPIGGVAADEPRAATIGRDILSAGGNAADAAVAMGFTLAFTYPAAAGLGGGGLCLAYDQKSNAGFALDFLPRAPAAGGEVAVPLMTRGLLSLHARFGRLGLAQVTVPAENLARFGVPLSRALATRIQAQPDPAIRRLIGLGDGQSPTVGTTVTNFDFAGTLARIRAHGVVDFYTGALAGQLVEGIAASGGKVDLETMRRTAAGWSPAASYAVGDAILFAPTGEMPGGEAMAALWRDLLQGDAVQRAGPAARERVLREAADKARLGRRPVPGWTNLVAVDKRGNGIACVFTMGLEFGLRRAVPGTGVALASPIGDTPALGLGLLTNLRVKALFLSLAASGDAAAPARAIEALVAMNYDLKSARIAVSENRLGLAATVNTVFCFRSVPGAPESCIAAHDPKGFGLSFESD